MANINIPPQKVMPNLLHTLPAWADEEKGVVNGLIENNTHGLNKYEFITETGHMKLDRVGYSSLMYPFAYGLLPSTWDMDSDMLDVVVTNVSEPIAIGCLAELRIIGVIKFEDKGEQDDKIITVLNDDMRMSHINSYTDLGAHWEKEARYFLEHYKDLKKPGTSVVQGFHGPEEARKIINECVERYTKEYIPKFDVQA